MTDRLTTERPAPVEAHRHRALIDKAIPAIVLLAVMITLALTVRLLASLAHAA